MEILWRKFLSFEKDLKVDRTLYQHSDTFGRKHWQLGGLELPAPRGDQPPQRKPMKASYRIFLLASQKFPDPSTISNNRVHRTPSAHASAGVCIGVRGSLAWSTRSPRPCARVAHASRWFRRRVEEGGRGAGARASTTLCRCTGRGARV